MKRRITLVPIFILSMGLILCACGNQNDENSAEHDTKLDNPTTILSNAENITRDYGNKTVVNGFWVKEIPGRSDGEGSDKLTVYTYIPLLKTKLPGYIDIEDDVNNVDLRSMMGINMPEGTKCIYPKSIFPGMSYYSQPKLGYNSPEIENDMYVTDLVRSIGTFGFGYENGNLYKFDVQCITIVLYKELYENYPDMKLKIYGMQEEERTRYYNQKGEFDGKSYTKMLSECRENGFSNCELVGEKKVTETSKFYIDYQNLTDKYGYDQYLIAMEVSETSGFAYYLNAFNCYEVEDRATFEKWKKENSSLLIGE